MVYYDWKSFKIRISPVKVFKAFAGEKNAFFLDSSLNSGKQQRYSFVGFNPFYIFSSSGVEPFSKLRQIMRPFKLNLSRGLPPFLAGGVGYFSYDLGFVLEDKLVKKNKDDLKIPECFFAFYNTTIIFDSLKNSLHLFSCGFPEKNYLSARALCKANINQAVKILSEIEQRDPEPVAKRKKQEYPVYLNSNFTKKEYLLAVKQAKEYIRRGDIYQVNLSQRFHAKGSFSALQLYRRLRQLSPSHFSAYFDAGDFQILSSSPERFLKLDSAGVITCPMKGTRPRGRNKEEDRYLKKQLWDSLKDKAELNMIVDLERNDLGRVCKYDSIRVDKLRQMESYKTVFQTTATISGKLHKDKDGFDLLRACFPGGSITGCPKIRSMEIIEKLENSRRNIYTGSLGYLSSTGNMDFNILIRTILKKSNNLYFGSGGGIVTDSNPEAEYKETLVKARALTGAIYGRDSIFK